MEKLINLTKKFNTKIQKTIRKISKMKTNERELKSSNSK